MDRPISMKDIALAVGVDRSTVSRALRNSPWIPPWTRNRIKAVAAEMGYVLSKGASELAGMRSRTIGACLPGLGDPSINEQVLGLDGEAQRHRYKVLVAFCHESGELECVRDFQERRVAGIVVFRSASTGRYTGSASAICPVVAARPFDPSCHRSSRAVGIEAFESLLDLMPPDAERYSRYRSR